MINENYIDGVLITDCIYIFSLSVPSGHFTKAAVWATACKP